MTRRPRAGALLVTLSIAGCGGPAVSEEVTSGMDVTSTSTELDPADSDTQISVDPADYVGMTWQEAMKSCLEEFGWTVTVAADGGVETRFTPIPAQQAQRVAEQDACVAAAPSAPEPNRSDYERVYELRVRQYECLVDQGFAGTEPSSLEEFIASGGAWSPLNGFPPDLGAAAQAACPEPA